MHDIIAIILAGGSGHRFGLAEPPKQYQPLDGQDNIVNSTVKRFLQHDQIDQVQVVIGQDHNVYYQPDAHNKLLPPVVGGRRRQDSVCNGLEVIQDLSPRLVLIHDAVRPFVSEKLIDGLLQGLQNNLAVVPAMPAVDSLVRSDHNQYVTEYISRENIYTIQTPQGFHYSEILRCHQLERDGETVFTDDGALFVKYNLPVATIKGESNNIKITYKEDVHV